MQFINIGFGNLISKNRVVAVVSPESSPKTRAVIFMDSGHIVLTSLQTDTILQRTEKINKE